MKHEWLNAVLAVLFFLLLFFVIFVGVAYGQQPLPVATPWYLATAYPGQLPTPWYLPTAPVIWTPWPTPLPPPTIGPTAAPWGTYQVMAVDVVQVYPAPNISTYWGWRLAPGEIVTVRDVAVNWVQIESGYLTGAYAQRTYLQRV